MKINIAMLKRRKEFVKMDEEETALAKEKNRVTERSRNARYSDSGVMDRATAYCGSIFRRHMRSGSVLELGPAEGVMTDLLAPYFDDYTIVDGADFFVNAVIKRHPQIKGYALLFEEFMPDRKYDNIVLGHVLEHVEDPVKILKLAASWMTEGGGIFAAVPNSNSIHRQAAVLMGLLSAEDQLGETDIKNGHRRVYNKQLLERDFINAGLRIIKSGGYWLKPESNDQINAGWNGSMIDAFLKLGENYPEIAGELYVIAAK